MAIRKPSARVSAASAKSTDDAHGRARMFALWMGSAAKVRKGASDECPNILKRMPVSLRAICGRRQHLAAADPLSDR